jgi:outer membrane protein
MKLGRSLCAAVAVALSFLLTAGAASAQSKIAVIDVQRAVVETEEGLRVQATLRKLFDSRNSDLDAKQRKLEVDKAALEAAIKAGKVPKATLQTQAETLQKQWNEIQQETVAAQREFEQKQRDLTNPIVARILDITRRIAALESYEMVVEKAAVPYFRADLEITDRAIQMYNSGQFGANAPGKTPGTPPAKNEPLKQPAPPPALPAPKTTPATPPKK